MIYGTPDDDDITPDYSSLPGGELPTDSNDTIFGLDGDDALQGGLGNDTLYGGDGRDLLIGDLGNDKLYGGGDSDSLIADGGFDELYGGDGDDTLSITAGRGDALMDGGEGIDVLTIDFKNLAAGVTFVALNANGVYTIPGSSTLAVSNFEQHRILGTRFDDVITGSDGNDFLLGVSGNDKLFGGNGDDTIIQDWSSGEFDGGAGRDRLISSFYSATSGVTADFNGGTGTLSSSLGTLQFQNFESVQFDGSQFDDILIGSSGIDFLYGHDGDDILIGGGQADTIYGGFDPVTDGFDIAVYSGNRADYTIVTRGSSYATYISDNRPGSPDGFNDMLYSIERLRFADGDYDWDATTQTYVLVGSGDNEAPVGVADSYSIVEDGVLTVNTAASLLANDTDADNESLSIASFTNAAHGSLLVNANGSFTYTPTGNYNGADSFTYTVTDGTDTSGPITVSLNVTPVNDAPTNFLLSISRVSEGTPQWTTLGTLRAQDVDGDALTYTLLDADGGPFSMRGNRLVSNGAFDFETRPSYDIEVGVSDGTTTVQKIFHIDVLDIYEPPANLASVDLRFSKTAVKENTAIGTSLGLLSATDPEGGTLHWSLLDDASGTFRVVGNKIRITGNIDYETTPQISFTAQVQDNAGNTTQKTFTLDVIDVAEPAGMLHGLGEIPLI